MRSTVPAGVFGALPLGVALLLSACGIAPPPGWALETPAVPVWLISHDWHSGLVLRRADIPEDRIPERAGFAAADYLEFGWGDRDFYPAPDSAFWRALDAGLFPGPAALHVVGFTAPPREFFSEAEVIRIDLPTAGYRSLARFIHDSFARPVPGPTVPFGPGLYGGGRFFAATGQFHLFENCNVWVARALRAGGLPIAPAGAVTAGALLRQARPWGRIEPAPTRPATFRLDHSGRKGIEWRAAVGSFTSGPG